MGMFDGVFDLIKFPFEFGAKLGLQKQQAYLNEQLARNAYKRQIEFYNMQNAYNDPSAVVERYKKAGLNPTSAFGVAGSYQPAQQSASVPEASGVSLPSISLGSGSIPDPLAIERQLAEIANIKADTRKKEGETLDPEETQRGQHLENSLLEGRVIGQELANRITENDAEFSDYALGNRKQLSDLEVTRAIETNNKIIADIALSASQKDLNEQMARESVARIFQTEAQTALLQNQNQWYGKLTEAQIRSINQGIDESLNRMSLNDSIKFLNAAREWNTMADTKGKELDNWRKELANNLSGFEYGSGDTTNSSPGGKIWYTLQKFFDLFHIFK